jgi:hypothetical protein
MAFRGKTRRSSTSSPTTSSATSCAARAALEQLRPRRRTCLSRWRRRSRATTSLSLIPSTARPTLTLASLLAPSGVRCFGSCAGTSFRPSIVTLWPGSVGLSLLWYVLWPSLALLASWPQAQELHVVQAHGHWHMERHTATVSDCGMQAYTSHLKSARSQTWTTPRA